jgi:hypothetical protein
VNHLEQIGTRAVYRPPGQVTFERTARALGLADMLVDARQLTGLGDPGVLARHTLGST